MLLFPTNLESEREILSKIISVNKKSNALKGLLALVP